MASGGMVPLQVPAFNTCNYNNWSIKMKTLFGPHDVWEVWRKATMSRVMSQCYLQLKRIEKEIKKERKKALGSLPHLKLWF